jgi:hypothetical protein
VLSKRERAADAPAIEGALETIGDARCARAPPQVAVDDRLSRGRDNAQERGVAAEFP